MKVGGVSPSILILFGCDSIPVNYNLDKCRTHVWSSGIYKIVKIEEM